MLCAAAIVVALLALVVALGGAPSPAPVARPTVPGPPGPVTGFPDASDTGVPARVRLLAVPSQLSSGRGWHYDQRGFVAVDGNGAVLAGLSIACNVDITGSDVTLADDEIVVGGVSAVAITLRGAADVTIEDSTIRGKDAGAGRMMAGIKDVDGSSTGTRVLRDNISLFETGVQLESGLVEDNYVHDPGFIPGDHTNGIMSNGGTTAPLVITHNTILIDRGQTDAIGLFEDFGAQANRVIADNLLAGGGYAIYAGQDAGGITTQNIVIKENRLSRIYYPDGGYYGVVTDFNSAGPGDVCRGNSWNSGETTLTGGCN